MKRLTGLAAAVGFLVALLPTAVGGAPPKDEWCWETTGGTLCLTVPTSSQPPVATTTIPPAVTTTMPPATTTTIPGPTTTYPPPVTSTIPPATTTTSTTPIPPPQQGWPNAANTGPTGTLTPYTAPCTIDTAGVTLTNRQINCDLRINAPNVTIRNSAINGTLIILPPGSGFQLIDGFVDGHSGLGTVAAQGGAMFTILRSEIVGGLRGVWCANCTLRDSYMHGNSTLPGDHASAVRADYNTTMIHNTFHCDVVGNCSADQTGYPDFGPTHHWTITNNYYVAASSWYCAYGGATAGKTYSNHPDNATYIVYRDNVFERGANGRCGQLGGGPIASFNATREGNVWQNNRWSDGTIIPG